MTEEHTVGPAGDPLAHAMILKRQSQPKEPEYCVACCTSTSGGASEIVADFGPFDRDEAGEIASEMQAMDCEGANYYPRRLSPAELRRKEQRRRKRS